jgi:poly(A) polymerase
MRRIISKVVQTLFGRRRRAEAAPPAAPPRPRAREEKAAAPVIVKREEHTLSRSRIDEDALKVLNRLTRYGHTAYLVGGGVRDLLLDRPVKDFDIATSAHPQEIKRLFRNCRLIGKRFRLAHILFKGGKVIEVSTFRKQTGFSDEAEILIRSDNTFGTPEEDAVRRDFTVNGLFYSITDFTVIDYVGGLEDLKKRVLRTIGDPNIRFREDPIRILRAIRLAARLGFEIGPKTRAAMTAHREEIWKSAAPRIVDEFVRMLNQGAAAASFPLLAELGVLAGLLPSFAKAYAAPGLRAEIDADLASLDAHQKPRQGLLPGLALAVLYFPAFNAAVAAAGPEADRSRIAGELLDGDLARLKFPRAQLEKAVQLLASQQRLVQGSRRRGRPAPMAGKGWFADALVLFEITQGDTPEGGALLQRWRSQMQRELEAQQEGGEPAEGDVEGVSAEGAEGAGEEGAAERPAGRRRRSRRGGRGRGRGRRREGAAAEGAAPAGGPAAETDFEPPADTSDEGPDSRAD